MSMQGRIPLYNRGALARESGGDVNVPDTAGDFTRVSNMLFNTAEQNIAADNRRYAQLEAARLKAEKEKRAMSDDIAAERALLDWENSAYQALEQQKQQNFANPWSVYDGIDGRINESIDSYASQIANPDVADKFRKRAATSTRAIQNNVRTWATNQDSQNIMTNLQSGLESLYTRAGNAASLNEVAGLISQSDSFTLNAASAIGPEQAKKMADSARRQIAENFIYSRIDNSPNEIASYINGGVFDGIFDDKEQHTILGNAQRIIEKRQREADDAAEALSNWALNDTLIKARTGALSLQDINKMIAAEKRMGGKGTDKRMAVYKRAREAILSSGRYPYAKTSQNEALVAINEAFSDVTRKKIKYKEGEEVPLGAPTYEYSLDGLTKEQYAKLTAVVQENAHLLSQQQMRNWFEVLNQLGDQLNEGNPKYQEAKEYQEALSSGSTKNIPKYDEYLNTISTMNAYIDAKIPSSRRGYVRTKVLDLLAANHEKWVNKQNYSRAALMRYLVNVTNAINNSTFGY